MDDRDRALLFQHLATRDVPCPSCEYNLRGLTSETCPECGVPITIGSLKLEWLVRGLDIQIIRWGCLVPAAGSACFGAGFLFPKHASAEPAIGATLIGLACVLAALGLGIFGVDRWMVAEPTRRRVCSALGAMLIPLGGFGVFLGFVSVFVGLGE